jgi:hypothetical protein
MKLPLLIASGIGLCFCLYSCRPGSRFYDESNRAYVPVYIPITEKNNIAISNVRTTEKAGKIYAFGRYIFQNDVNKGIHIIDNADRAHPQKIAFLSIPYNTEFAVKGNYIYANNINDLIVVDIRDITNPVVIKRMENAFPYVNQEYPEEPGYFVCPDPSKGIIVDWEFQTVSTSPACRH